MHSLKQQLMMLVIGPLLILSIFLTIIIGMQMKDRVLLATISKARSDLATGEALIDAIYPGDWKEQDGILYKGGVRISNNLKIVDKIASLTGDTVTIFLGDTRVSTTVREKNGDRAIGTRASDKVANMVLKNGQEYFGEANVVGEIYQTAYKPIRDENGNIIGMFYVGISKKLSDQLIRNSLITIIAISIGLTLLVAIIAWFFTQKVIINPLQQITMGAREAASGHISGKVAVTAHNEIGELAAAYNQMLEGMQKFALHITKSAGNIVDKSDAVREEKRFDSSNSIPDATDIEDDLPKGLNEATFRQILNFLESKNEAMSAEEIGEGVNLTRVTVRRYLEYLEKNGRVAVEIKYGMVGRPVKLYKSKS